MSTYGQQSNPEHPGQSGHDDPPTAATESTGELAQQEVGELKDSVADAGRDVMETATDEARQVAHEAKDRTADVARGLFDDVRQQAGEQQGRLADGLHSVASDLGQMASRADDDTLTTQLVHEASRRIGAAAHWLSGREPDAVLDEVRRFARRNPVTFLAGAALAGVVVGRLTRNVMANRSESTTGSAPSARRVATPGSPTAVQPRAVLHDQPEPRVSEPADAIDPPQAVRGPGSDVRHE